MPVLIDKAPAPKTAPPPPRLWRWLLLLPLLLLLGVGLTLWLGRDTWADQPTRFWLVALAVPLLSWCALGFFRALGYLAQASIAEGWSRQRAVDLARKLGQGRRSQQVLALSMYTALRESDAQDGAAQQLALRSASKALTVQADWGQAKEGVRHSRLACEQGETPETLLLRVTRQVLADIAKVLTALPHDRPLALLLEMNSSLPEQTLNERWQQVWSESGIRQPVSRIDGAGLAAVDHWLDQRIHDQALLLVVALQLAPAEVEGTAETAVGLLFGNRLTQTLVEPLAYLHRPEQARAAGTEALCAATHQALDWVPLSGAAICHAWQAGTEAHTTSSIATVVSECAMSLEGAQGLYNLDAMLGNPGCVTPWLAIAAAVASVRTDAAPQVIFTGKANDPRLWCSVVMPASSNQEQQTDAQ
ncbi:hypothetical protein [Pseudomonas sp.]|uniref:hypothetical protein n=1 Tax=Pseudomonas sp. TaxID=306 RepID=UPI003D6F5C95